jgi:DNA-binding response OmpR family regulator
MDTMNKLGVDKVDIIVMNGRMASYRTTVIIVSIKSLSYKIKIFVIAERYLDGTKTRVLDYGAGDFVLEPISVNSVVEKVNMLLIESVTDGSGSSSNISNRSSGLASYSIFQ